MTAVPPPPPESAGVPAPAGGGSNGLAITSMILGIVSVLTCLYFFLAMPLGAAAIVTGVLGRKSADVKGGNGLALTGIITGAIGFVLGLILVILGFVGEGLTNDWLCDIDPAYC